MAEDIQSRIADDMPVRVSAVAPGADSGSQTSVPLKPNPPALEYARNFIIKSLSDFYYNAFRLIGYVAQAVYSVVHRSIFDRLYGKHVHDDYEGGFFRPDFLGGKGAKSRMIIHAIEFTAFEGLAVAAFLQDKGRFRSTLADVVAAEKSKPAHSVALRDVLASENPLIQTAVNRFKGLYIMRLLQPFTFLWSLSFALTAMALEIVGERSAYLEKNAYDRLQQLVKEIGNNQLGTWARKDVVARLVEVVQQSRADHDTPPLLMDDMEKYFPLLNQITDRMLEKKWRLPEALYILGQIIREPAAPQKAQAAYDDVMAHGLAGIAAGKGRNILGATTAAESEFLAPAPTSQKVKDIVAQGPKSAQLAPAAAEMAAGR